MELKIDNGTSKHETVSSYVASTNYAENIKDELDVNIKDGMETIKDELGVTEKNIMKKLKGHSTDLKNIRRKTTTINNKIDEADEQLTSLYESLKIINAEIHGLNNKIDEIIENVEHIIKKQWSLIFLQISILLVIIFYMLITSIS